MMDTTQSICCLETHIFPSITLVVVLDFKAMELTMQYDLYTMVPFWQLALGVEPLQLLQVSVLPPKVVVALVWCERPILMVFEVLFTSISSF
jgi:hypothetical protein